MHLGGDHSVNVSLSLSNLAPSFQDVTGRRGVALRKEGIWAGLSKK